MKTLISCTVFVETSTLIPLITRLESYLSNRFTRVTLVYSGNSPFVKETDNRFLLQSKLRTLPKLRQRGTSTSSGVFLRSFGDLRLSPKTDCQSFFCSWSLNVEVPRSKRVVGLSQTFTEEGSLRSILRSDQPKSEHSEVRVLGVLGWSED